MKGLTRVTGLLLAVCLLAGLAPVSHAAPAPWDGTVAESFAGGSGTESDPYRIETGAQLALLAKLANEGETNDVFYALTRNIDLGGLPWTPIGSYRWAYCKFEGNFDGRGHAVTNLFVDAEVTYADSDETYAGLFGYVSLGTIQNLSVSGTVQSIRSAHPTVGGIVGILAGYGVTIWNDELAAVKGSLILNCSFTGTVTVQAEGGDERDSRAVPYVGGIAGFVGEKSAVLNCRNDGTVTCSSSHVVYCGGIAGHSELRISGCCNSGDVTGISAREATLSGGWGWENYTGGIVGNHSARTQTTYIDHCCSTGNVTAAGGEVQVGGIIGFDGSGNNNTVVESCFSTRAVTGSSLLSVGVGGIVGVSSGDTQIQNCYCAGSVAGDDDAMVGGILGRMSIYYSRVTLKTCYAAGPVSGGVAAKVGGILGACKRDSYDKSSTAYLNDCFYLRTEDVNDDLEWVGDTGSWYDRFQDIVPLSAETFGDAGTFAAWDREIWVMADGLNGAISALTARPVLLDPYEPDVTAPVLLEGLTVSDGRATVRVNPASDLDTVVIFASYAPGGALVSSELLPVTPGEYDYPEYEVPEGAETVRAFLVDETWTPLAPRLESAVD